MSSFKYKNVPCASCNEKFTEKDDVVVCPDCGSPHHRDCYMASGHCANIEKHSVDYSWSAEYKRSTLSDDIKYDGMIPAKCPNCSAVNPADSQSCQICGTKMEMVHTSISKPMIAQHLTEPMPIKYDHITTPFGGVPPEEKIGDVSAKEIALFVGNNAHYFIPKFKQMQSTTKNSNWNWCAFLFNFLYLFYRKMYAMGAIFLALFVILQIPSFLFASDYLVYATELLQTGVVSSQTLEAMQPYVTMNNITSIIVFISGGVLASTFNKMYMQQVIRHIKVVREVGNFQSENDYANALSQAGRVSMRVSIMVALMLIIALFGVSYLIVLSQFGMI